MTTTNDSTHISDLNIPITVAAKIFYDDDLVKALQTLQEQQYRALFIPEFADARIASNKDSPLWDWYLTQSLKATGKTKARNPVVVYAHIPHYFSNPKHITEARTQGLRNGAGPIPQKEFLKILTLEDEQTVFVRDHDTLSKATYGLITIKEALAHPQTIPFIGGQERATTYLQQHQNTVGPNIIINYCDDLADQPYGRLLFAGHRLNYGRLCGNYLHLDGRFVGVPSRSAAGGAPKTAELEQLAGKGREVGNDLIVLRKDQIPPALYQLLTRT